MLQAVWSFVAVLLLVAMGFLVYSGRSHDGKIENGAWLHSGLSSRGEPLNEVWKRLPKSAIVAPPRN